MSKIGLPELPEPAERPGWDIGSYEGFDYYSEKQMLEYAEAAILAERNALFAEFKALLKEAGKAKQDNVESVQLDSVCKGIRKCLALIRARELA